MSAPGIRPPGLGFTALVLAASRGADDAVARARGVSHKCLARVGGVPMLVRVVEALRACACVERIAVSIDAPALLETAPELASLAAGGKVVAVASGATPVRSVLAAAAALDPPFPMLVTTADHALLTPAMVAHFCAEVRASGVDVAAGLAPASVILRDYPGALRTFLRFRDDRYSGCNLFALMTSESLRAVEFWAGVEPYRKQPWRMMRCFGPLSLLLFAAGALTLDGAMGRVSKVVGVGVGAVKMPFAEAAIDVDKPADLVLVEGILARGPQDSRAPAP